MWFDNTFIGLLTKLGYDVARAIHFYEAWLATLAILVWHLYYVIFNPDAYPMNMAWLTGMLTEREMEEEHPLELERIREHAARRRRDRAGRRVKTSPKDDASRRKAVPGPFRRLTLAVLALAPVLSGQEAARADLRGLRRLPRARDRARASGRRARPRTSTPRR